MLLTDEQIAEICVDIPLDTSCDIAYARAIESAVLEKLKAQEPYVIEYPEYHQQGMGCGLEDRNITDRYEAMAYGWDCAIDAMAECIPDRLYEHPLPPADVVRDAERYKWLRKVAPNMLWDSHDKEIGFVRFDTKAYLWKPEMFDAAIDAAMKGDAA